MIRLATLGVLAAIYGIVLSRRWAGRSMWRGWRRSWPVRSWSSWAACWARCARPGSSASAPWTPSSKRSWGKTHRLGGWLFIADGLLLIAAGAARSELLSVLALAAIGSSLLALWVYLYLVWRGDDDRTPPVGSRPAEEGA